MNSKALDILFSTYWTSAGWKQPYSVSNADFEYAKSEGVMFDSISPSHADAVAEVRRLTKETSLRAVADAFLASLSTRRLEWRSALGSYMAMRYMPFHEATVGERVCLICGMHDYHHLPAHDLNVLNFSRLKWGGLDHTSPIYAALDLLLFIRNPPSAPNETDIEIFRQLISAIGTAPATTTSATLHKLLPSALKANKAERDQLIAILGICGILATADHPGFAREFVPRERRALPSRHFIDMAYPACWWKGSEGLNAERLQEVFGHAL